MSIVSDISATLQKTGLTGIKSTAITRQLTPIWSVRVKGQDVSDRISPRLISLSLSDNRDGEADELELLISDHDNAVKLPDTGDEIHVSLGWKLNNASLLPGLSVSNSLGDFQLGLVNKGSYTVQAIECSGSPDTITIRARAANLLDSLRTLRDRSWHATTLGTVVRSIASQNQLAVRIDKEIANRKLAHADQTHESDAAFLRRLGRQFDCLCNIKNNTLLFSQARASRTPSGKALPAVSIQRSDGDSHRWARADRDAYSGVKAYYNNTKKGTRASVIAGISGKAKTLRQTFASQADALAAARAEWLRIQRGIFSFDITLAHGRADLTPQRPVVVSGFKPQIDSTPWIISAVRHSLSAQGYTTQLTLETLQAEGVEGEEGAEDGENADSDRK